MSAISWEPKYTFLVTIVTMGLSTALIGFLPTYAQIGRLAPALLVPIAICVLTVVVGGLFIRETRHHPIDTPIH